MFCGALGDAQSHGVLRRIFSFFTQFLSRKISEWGEIWHRSP
jgi:hypothetical protein